MKSTCRAFRDWVGSEIPTNVHMDNVIIGQAARHAIVHTGGKMNKKLMARVRNAQEGATLGLNLAKDERVQFTPSLVDALGESMVTMIQDIAGQLKETPR